MKRIVGFGLAMLLVSVTASAQERGPSTPEERATAVKAARLLEEEPLGPRAKAARQWFTVWLIAVPDITVSVCGDLLPDIPRSVKKFSSELIMQTAYSAAAFMIEHPDQAKDRVAVYNAGLLGALKTYESIRKEQPKLSWPAVDELLRKRDTGDLADYVAAATQKCDSKR